MDDIAAVRKILSEGRVVAITGAGVSQESGIPTFRGVGGLWEKYPPEDFATPDGLMRVYKHDLPRLTQFVRDFYLALTEATPNRAHFGLAKMEEDNILSGIITQNIDDLHARAGSKKVMELHGNAFRLRCMRCAKKKMFSIVEIRRLLDHASSGPSKLKMVKMITHFFKKCDCGSRMRIDIVLFSEPLPSDVWQEAWQSIEEAKTVLLVGTSGVVYPAASLPVHAKELKKKIIEVNLERSDLSDLVDHVLLGKAGEILDQLTS